MYNLLYELLTYKYHKISFWLFAMAILLLTSVIMIVLGHIWFKKASKNYKCFYGYKTREAKADQEAWEYVNRKIGQLWMISGAAMFILDICIMLQCMHGAIEEVTLNGLILLMTKLFTILCLHFYVKINSKGKLKTQ